MYTFNLEKTAHVYLNTDMKVVGTSKKADNNISVLQKNNSLNQVSHKYRTVLDVLTELNDDAQTDFDNQKSNMGWIAKTTDFVADKLGSKYCKKDIFDAVNQHKYDIERLAQASKNGSFDGEFFNIFGINYDENSVKNFKNIYDKNVNINIAKQKAKDNKNALNEYVKYFSEDNNYKNSQVNIDKQLENFEKALIKTVGDKDTLDKIFEKQRDFGESNRNEKIRIYSDLAKIIMSKDNLEVQKLTEGKSDLELKKEYNESYLNAFGSKNNIGQKVTNYALAQKTRKYLFKVYTLKYGVKSFSLATNIKMPVVKASVRAAAKMGMDTADILTRNTDNKLDSQKIHKLAKNSVFSGLKYFAIVKMYKAVPKVTIDNDIANYGANELRKFGIRKVCGTVMDKIKKLVP